MNCYVLYCQSYKIENLCQRFNQKEGIEAFIPQIEKHLHSTNELVLKPLFPGYIFIKTKLNQIEFDTFLLLMKEEKNGVIRELKKDDVSALTKDEIHLLKLLLNEQYILKMSKGYKQTNKTIIIEGPLKQLQEHIISVNKREHFAILNIEFLNRRIKAGIEMQDKEI